MRVLIFIKEFAAPTLTFIYNEIIGISKRAEVKVITCSRINENLFPFDEVEQFDIYRSSLTQKYIEKLQHKDLEALFINRTFEKKLNTVISEFQPDIIHSHFGHQSWLLWKNNKHTHIPLFISFHGYDASHKLRSPRYRQTLKKVIRDKHVQPIFVSHHMQRSVETSIDHLLPKSNILYYGTDIAFFQPGEAPEKKAHTTFLQISSFAEKKGHFYTLKAFSLYLSKSQNKHDQLILAGDGHLREQMILLADRLGLKDNVQFPGLIDRVEARSLMDKANIFVHNSVTSLTVGDKEGIPNAIMEAMAMELPILSTYHSGIPELVTHGEHGLLSKERDIEEYAENFSKIASWSRCPHNRQKIKLHFEKEQHCDKLISLYEKALTPIA